MTKEILAEAEKLIGAIEKAEKFLQNSKGSFSSIDFNTSSNSYRVCIDKNVIGIIQAIVIADNEKKLNELKQEFDNL